MKVKVLVSALDGVESEIQEWMDSEGDMFIHSVYQFQAVTGLKKVNSVCTTIFYDAKIGAPVTNPGYGREVKEEGSPECPSCGDRMTIRYRRADRSPFWGCTQFPSCRGILGYEEGKAGIVYSRKDDPQQIRDNGDDDYGDDIPF